MVQLLHCMDSMLTILTTTVPCYFCPYPHPLHPASTRLPCEHLPPPPFLWVLLSLFTFAMLAKCFAGPHGSQIRPSKSDNAGPGSALACQLIPIVDCFKQKMKKGHRYGRGSGREMRWGESNSLACSCLHGELFISSTFTHSGPHFSALCLDRKTRTGLTLAQA